MSPLMNELVLSHERQPVNLREARTLRVRTGGTLVVRRGRVWLTVDGEAHDRVIGPGDQLVLDRGHRAVLEPWSYVEAADLCWCAVEPPRRWASVVSALLARLRGFIPLRPGATAR